jgi:hypothetical protein
MPPIETPDSISNTKGKDRSKHQRPNPGSCYHLIKHSPAPNHSLDISPTLIVFLSATISPFTFALLAIIDLMQAPHSKIPSLIFAA